MVAALLLGGCGARQRGSRPPSSVISPVAGAPEQAISPAAADGTPASDRQWAAQALRILDLIDAAVKDYHASSELPYNSVRALQLRQSAYAGFQQAVAAHQLLLPATREVKDAQDRDQYMFVVGNIGGFLTPTPDLPADRPTLGDRIARSLENAIAASAALRPRLERLSRT
ncbi:MAG TPA: hypothetical protein VK821_09995 [Dehalococcoidia bacterium]|nr:hypothetical protein [Dehalococcoidia bacterium]